MFVGHENVSKGVADCKEDCGDEHDAGHVDDLGCEAAFDVTDGVWN